MLSRSAVTAAILLVFGGVADADIQAYVPQRVMGVPQPMPLFYSGTFCRASWEVYSTPNTNPIERIVVKINGITVDELWRDQEIMVWPSAAGAVIFDSTQIPDSAQIQVQVTATNLQGQSITVTGVSTGYNKGFVYGNVNPLFHPDGIGNMIMGKAAADLVADKVTALNHTVNPVPAGRVNREKTAILNAIAPHTVFYAWSHGIIGAFGDSAAFQTDQGARYEAHWIGEQDVLDKMTDPNTGKMNTTVNPPVVRYPPYNLVFIDSCETGGSATIYNNFGVTNALDRAGLGWPSTMLDNQHNLDWTNRLFTKLAEGFELTPAIDYANDPDGDMDMEEYARKVGQIPISPTPRGDPEYKLHGVYGVPGLQLSYR